MHRRTTRLNHLALTVLGLLLAAFGAYLVLRHYDLMNDLTGSGQSADDKLFSGPEISWLHHHSWLAYIIVAVVIVIGLLALRWLFVQPRVDRITQLRIDTDPGQAGRTRMHADVITSIVEDDVESYVGVAGARAVLIGEADDPELMLRVAAHPGMDIGAVYVRIVEEALPSVRTAMNSKDLRVQIHLFVAGKADNRRTIY